MAHVFISYKHEDGDSAELIKNRLEKEGFATWIDSDIQGGEKWSPSIDSAITNSFALIVIMSPEARKSEYITYEWSFALGMGKTVIPILLRTTDLHPKLAEFKYIDFTNRNARPWDMLLRRLKEEIENAPAIKPEQDVVNRISVTSHYKEAVPRLISDLIAPNVSVRLKAIETLARIGDDQCIEGIIDALRDRDHDIRIAAADALGNFRTTVAVSALIRTLQDKIGYVRARAAKSLGTIGDARAVPALSKLLDDKTVTVRRAAFDALEKIGTPKALAAVEEWHRQQSLK